MSDDTDEYNPHDVSLDRVNSNDLPVGQIDETTEIVEGVPDGFLLEVYGTSGGSFFTYSVEYVRTWREKETAEFYDGGSVEVDLDDETIRETVVPQIIKGMGENGTWDYIEWPEELIDK